MPRRFHHGATRAEAPSAIAVESPSHITLAGCATPIANCAMRKVWVNTTSKGWAASARRTRARIASER